MANKIQIRRDTTANWTASDPILSQGELGLDTTLNKIKIGDGTSNWSDLSFYFGDQTSLINGSHTVALNSTGGVNFPTLSIDIHNGGVQSAQVLKFDKASQQVIITGPTPAAGVSAERIIIQGQRATGNGEGGDVYLWGGDSDINGGDIKIYAGDADSDVSGSIGGYVNIDAGNGFTNGGNLTLSAGVARIVENGYGGNVSITAGYAHNGTPGNIQLSTYAQSNNSVLSWTFTNDGKLQLPTGGDVVNSDGNSITDIYKFAYGTIGTKANPDTLNGWGGYNMYLDPGGESWASIFIPSNAGQDDGAALQITNKGAANSIVQVFGWGGVQLVTNTGSDEKVFEFGDNGKLTLPAGPTLLTNVSQITSAKIDRAGASTDGVAISNARDIWIGAETVWADIRDQDEQFGGYVWPWSGMPSWEGYPLLMNYNSSGTPVSGILPPSSALAPAGNNAVNAYLAYKQLLSSIDIVSGNKTFSFENTGELRVPGVITKDNNLVLGSAGVSGVLPTGNFASVTADGQYGRVIIRTDHGETETLHTWLFDINGALTFPNNTTQTTAWTGSVASLVNGSHTLSLGTDGKFNLPNNANIAKSTNEELDNAISSYTTAAANWVIYAEQETITAAALNITPTGWPWLNWRITDANAVSLLAELEAAWTVQNNPTSPPSPLVFNPAISQSLYTEIKTKILLIQSTAALVTLLSTSIDIVAGPEKLTLLGNGKLQVPDIIQNIPEENLILRTRYAVASSPPGTPLYTNRDWTFGTNGTLKFPDNTIQTTAYVSNITNTAANGTAALLPGYVMTRGTRLEIRTVYTDPNSLNMEFRYKGLGDQVTITANNGTNIFNGTSTSIGITWTRFNPAVFVNPGEKAEVVICDQSYHKIYRVTAIMRDIPTGDNGSGSVYCTIEELK